MTDNPISPGLGLGRNEKAAIEQWLAGQRVANLRDLLTGLIEGSYAQAIAPVVQAVLGNSGTGLLQQRLRELEAEAQRLEAEGLRLTPDNPVFSALLNDFSRINAQNIALMQGAAPLTARNASLAAGIVNREMAISSDDFSIRYNTRWNVPDPEAVAAVVDYTTRPTFAEVFDLYGQDVWSAVANQAIRGVVEGWGPLRTAREIRRVAEDYPASQAQNLMRTLQLTAYRDAAVVHQVANARIIQSIIRVAVLDARTCLACIAQHGDRLAVGQRVDDHHRGRCTGLIEIIGRPRSIQPGSDWFDALPDTVPTEAQRITKLALMGHANFEAYRVGAVGLRDFIQPYNDPLFGRMVREASLKGILGEDARQYYKRGAA